MSAPSADAQGYSTGAYFDLVANGLIGSEDHVELLDVIVIASPPQGPLHAAVIMAVGNALGGAVGGRAGIRVQMPFLAGARSVPEPDVALVPGGPADYRDRHPGEAFVVVEVADSSLPQERLTKSRIYAGAGVPEYWIVNLRERCVEVFTEPIPARRVYTENRRVEPGERIALVALPDTSVAVAHLFAGY
jgi:Uma2 family endonuclease